MIWHLHLVLNVASKQFKAVVTSSQRHIYAALRQRRDILYRQIVGHRRLLHDSRTKFTASWHRREL